MIFSQLKKWTQIQTFQIAIDFQENLLKTLLQIEDTINETVRYYHKEKNQNCIIIYDRGAMDPVACN